MIIHYWPGVRHKVVMRANRIESILQKRSFLFWSDIYPYNIHFEIREDPKISDASELHRIMPHINPSVMHFTNLGFGPLYATGELWDRSTFNLKERLYEIANDYAKSIKREKVYSSELEKQMAEL